MSAQDPWLPLISVHSFKGGVGKSSISLLLGLALAEKHKVCLVDLDLLAPGLHRLLGVTVEGRATVLDYLVGKPSDPAEAPSPEQVCHAVRPQLAGWKAGDVFLIPARPNLEQAAWIQGYVLADLRCELVQARLERLLCGVRSKFQIEVFVLDTPPSLFGVSGSVRALVEQQPGVLTFVSTPIWQDLAGMWDMVFASESRPRAAQAFVLNREEGHVGGKKIKKGIAQTIAATWEDGDAGRQRLEALNRRLDHYELAVLPVSDAIARLSRVLTAGQNRPSTEEILTDDFRNFAHRLMNCLTERAPT